MHVTSLPFVNVECIYLICLISWSWRGISMFVDVWLQITRHKFVLHVLFRSRSQSMVRAPTDVPETWPGRPRECCYFLFYTYVRRMRLSGVKQWRFCSSEYEPFLGVIFILIAAMEGARSPSCWKRLLASSCPSVCLQVTARLPLDGFPWNLILWAFMKISRESGRMSGCSCEDPKKPCLGVKLYKKSPQCYIAYLVSFLEGLAVSVCSPSGSNSRQLNGYSVWEVNGAGVQFCRTRAPTASLDV
jgi:hypothetical protein